MIKISPQKAAVISSALAVCQTDRIEVLSGENSVEIRQTNTPLIILSANLSEYAIAPLDLWYAADYVEDPGQISILPPELLGAMLEKLLQPYLTEASELLKHNITVTSYAGCDDAKSFEFSADFALRLDERNQPVPVRLFFRNETAVDVFVKRLRELPKTGALDESSIPVTMEKIAGSQMLTADEIRSLETGDAIVLQEDSLGRQEILLKGPGCACRVQISDGPEATVTQNGLEETDQESYGMDTKIDDLKLKVEFSLGTVDMTVNQLKELQPGSVVDIGSSDLSRVAIKISDQTVGHGQIIQVNDLYALQITDISGSSGL
ncbi:MAG: FliM/FliN family flagellar motor switch protein [Succinivibrionaceae bacterium]|nr:FliM/FliN family flagellar motor switch protein [Succinivibrionaceae bacterium]